MDDVNQLVQYPHREGTRAASRIENLAGVDDIKQRGNFFLIERERLFGIGEEDV
ncbi:hypothetical protein D3C84_1192090 [compost metagenome]